MGAGNLKFWTAAWFLALVCPSFAGSGGYEDTLTKAAGFRATGPTLTLPFTMVREYPFVPAVVNGVPGKLMLDTGGPEALVLDDRRVPLGAQTQAGSSFYTSGQHYDEHMNAVVDHVQLAGHLDYRHVTVVPSRDALQLEQHITPDFLGWIGYGFFQNYAMKFDYRLGQATFYRNEPGSVARYLAGEQVLARVPFELRRRPDDPFIRVRLGAKPFIAVLDSGQYGGVYTSKAVEQGLQAAGTLRPDVANADGPTYVLTGLNIGGLDVGPVPKVEVSTDPFPPARGMGIPEPDIITIGYGVLSKFKTVWDFPNKTIYFLKP